jgi:hypothetical protein
MTHWSCRTLAAKQGVSKSTINNIWQAHNLKPHRVKLRRFLKLSRVCYLKASHPFFNRVCE